MTCKNMLSAAMPIRCSCRAKDEKICNRPVINRCLTCGYEKELPCKRCHYCDPHLRHRPRESLGKCYDCSMEIMAEMEEDYWYNDSLEW